MVLLYLFALLLAIITFVISKVAKKRYGDYSVKHLKWELANSITVLIACLLGAVDSPSTFSFWTHIFLFVLFAVIAIIEGTALWKRVNNRKNTN